MGRWVDEWMGFYAAADPQIAENIVRIKVQKSEIRIQNRKIQNPEPKMPKHNNPKSNIQNSPLPHPPLLPLPPHLPHPFLK